MMGFFDTGFLKYLEINLLQFFLLILSISVHEFSHALIAERKGDSTPKLQGRLTLNPFAHIDPIGTILLPLLAILFRAPVIGWAKPVPVNPYNFYNPRKDMMMVGLAGPVSNLILAGISSFLLWFLGSMEIPSIVFFCLKYLIIINVILAVFNLIPVPPLDGSRIISGILPYKYLMYYEQLVGSFGIFILFFLIFSGILWQIINPIIYFLLNIFGLHGTYI